MKRIAVLLAALALSALSQGSPTLSLQLATTGTIRQGQSITINVVLSGSTGLTLSALQGTLALPASLTGVTVTAGPASIAASKQITCGAPAASLICILNGLNQTAYADGVVAVVTGTVSQVGTQTASLGGIVAANSAAKGVAALTGTPLSISVSPLPCDVNADGSFSSADLALINQQITGGNPPLSSDINGDGKVDAIDSQRVANATLTGGSCVTGP